MKLLLLTLGSHGDVHPFIALAREFSRRGHTSTLATNPHFQAQVQAAGVNFEPLGDDVDLADLLKTPGAMDPYRATKVVLRDIAMPMVPLIYQQTKELLAKHRPDVVLLHPICFGASWAVDALAIPRVPVILSPLAWFGARDVRVPGPFRTHRPNRVSRLIDDVIGRWYMRWLVDRPLNSIRRGYGLPAQKEILRREFTGGALNLALWSPAFRAECAGDPATGVICGFPWFDAHHSHQADLGMLEREIASEAPIVFSLGTAAVHTPGEFYTSAIEACAILKRRGLILMGRQGYIDALGPLPSHMLAATYAPFSWLLPKSIALVHHGGIGTTAQGLRAGIPTVITPLAFDQYDNAARCKRLGVSETVFHHRVTAQTLAGALAHVLNDGAFATRARELAGRITQHDGATRAVDAVERLLADGGFRART